MKRDPNIHYSNMDLDNMKLLPYHVAAELDDEADTVPLGDTVPMAMHFEEKKPKILSLGARFRREAEKFFELMMAIKYPKGIEYDPLLDSGHEPLLSPEDRLEPEHFAQMSMQPASGSYDHEGVITTEGHGVGEDE